MRGTAVLQARSCRTCGKQPLPGVAGDLHSVRAQEPGADRQGERASRAGGRLRLGARGLRPLRARDRRGRHRQDAARRARRRAGGPHLLRRCRAILGRRAVRAGRAGPARMPAPIAWPPRGLRALRALPGSAAARARDAGPGRGRGGARRGAPPRIRRSRDRRAGSHPARRPPLGGRSHARAPAGARRRAPRRAVAARRQRTRRGSRRHPPAPPAARAHAPRMRPARVRAAALRPGGHRAARHDGGR